MESKLEKKEDRAESVQDSEQRRYFQTNHLMGDLKGRVVRGGAATFGGQMLGTIVQMGSLMVLARLLVPADFGLIAMIAVVMGFVHLFKELGLSEATVQREEITQEQISTLFWINVGMGLVLTGVMMGLAPLLAWFYGQEKLLVLTWAISGGLFLSGLCTQHMALLRRQMKLATVAGIEVAGVILGAGIGIIAALKGAGVWALVFMELSGALGRTVLVWSLCKWRPGRPRRKVGVRKMLAFGGNLTGFNTINYLAAKLDVILVGRFCGALILGFYSRAFALLLTPLRQMNGPATNVAIPTLSRMSNDPERYRRAYFRMLNQIVMVTVVGVTFLITTRDWVVHILLGKQWEAAVPLFGILGFAGLIMPLLNTFGWLFISQGRTREMLHLGIVDAIVKVGSVLVGLYWGVTGVAVAVAVRYYLMLPVCLYFACRKGPVRTKDFGGTLLLAVILGITVLTAVTVYRHQLVFSEAVFGLTGCFALAGTVAILILFLLPKGRATLQDTVHSIAYLVKRERA